MYKRIKINSFDDYFIPYTMRKEPGIYIGRLASYNEQIHKNIIKYIEATRRAGISISNGLMNPTKEQLRYFDETMGRMYLLNPDFYESSLLKWIPRVRLKQRQSIANSFYDIFMEMAKNGKNENIQKNAYIKFMCWLYYRFGPLLQHLGNPNLPKILYEGDLNPHQQMILTTLATAGCDVLLLELQGDEAYWRMDPSNRYSDLIKVKGQQFPADFSILALQKELALPDTQSKVTTQAKQGSSAKVQTHKKVINTENKQQIHNNAPVIKESGTNKNMALISITTTKIINRNTWLSGDPYQDVCVQQSKRGSNHNYYYNVFAGIYGVEDKANYYTGLFKWKTKLEGLNKKVIIIEEEIPQPTFDEVSNVERKNCQYINELINYMTSQILCQDKIMRSYARASFIDIMKEEDTTSIQKLSNQAVVYVCLLNRYLKDIKFELELVPIFIFFGNLKKKHDEMLLKILSKMPIDVLHINPDLSMYAEINDKMFFPKKYPESMEIQSFPNSLNEVSFSTAAYQAERELDTVLYEDSGMYRNYQFKSAIAVTLQNTYEEISIYWQQEAKYRPNFEALANKVMVPVIFAKVNGVPGNIDNYWYKVSDYMEQKEVFVITSLPYNVMKGVNPFKDKSHVFLQNKKLNVSKIKSHSEYPFSFLRMEAQEFLLQKLQELIESKVINGTFTNGMEYTIISTILNMDKRLIRMIQRYDFTKFVPKVVVIHTSDNNATFEDGILLAYLNLIGFDIVMFVPTGNVCVEQYYHRSIFTDHQIGDYQYDLVVPDFNEIKRKKNNIVNRFLRRS